MFISQADCHDPSHGGSYMVEGRLLIRIGLCPHHCLRGLASQSLGRRVCYLVRSHWLCVVSCVPPSCRCLRTILSDSAVIWGCNSMSYLSCDYARVRPLTWYFVSHDGLCTILRRTVVLVMRSQVC